MRFCWRLRRYLLCFNHMFSISRTVSETQDHLKSSSINFFSSTSTFGVPLQVQRACSPRYLLIFIDFAQKKKRNAWTTLKFNYTLPCVPHHMDYWSIVQGLIIFRYFADMSTLFLLLVSDMHNKANAVEMPHEFRTILMGTSWKMIS